MHESARQRADSISFRQLKLFESIGRVNSVRKASDECNLSQPAVTQALAKLEQQAGFVLVDRRASGSYLNEFGTLFHARVCRCFAKVEEAMVELGIAGGAVGARLAARRLSRSQVRGLLAMVDHQSLDRAAQAIGLSPASLQRATRDLEANLRKPLFYRAASGIIVDPQAAEFGRRMKLALQEVEWGIKDMEAAEGSHQSGIVVGAMPFGGSVLLASALDELIQAYPAAQLRIVNESAPVLLRSLQSGDVDLVVGLLPSTPRPNLVTEALAKTPYSIVAQRGHPLLRKGRVTIEELLAYDWIVGTNGSSRRACFDRMFDGHSTPKAPIATCALPVIRHLLKGSNRLTLMTSYELRYEGDGLAALEFGQIAPVPEMGITMREGWLPTRLHRDFMEMLRHRAAALTTPAPLRQVG